MARKKSTETLDAEIAKVKSDMSKLQDKYNKLADKLKDLEDQNAGSKWTPSWMPTSKVARASMRS